VSKNKTEFFLDHLLLFFVSFEKKAQKKRTKERQKRTKFHTFEKRAKFELFSLCPRARILPKTIKKRRESKQKHKKFASLKISLPLFVVFVAL
jgi:hypothetical protein